jgi:hypothetical protein
MSSLESRDFDLLWQLPFVLPFCPPFGLYWLIIRLFHFCGLFSTLNLLMKTQKRFHMLHATISTVNGLSFGGGSASWALILLEFHSFFDFLGDFWPHWPCLAPPIYWWRHWNDSTCYMRLLGMLMAFHLEVDRHYELWYSLCFICLSDSFAIFGHIGPVLHPQSTDEDIEMTPHATCDF